MRCPKCELPVESLPCAYCAEREARWARDRRTLIAEFSLTAGPPTTAADIASLEFALAAMQAHLDQAQFQEPIKFDATGLLRCDEWWYIPFGWIGCYGFLVDRRDGYVNWLGSAMMTLNDCFWGHTRGIFCAPIDFTFTCDRDASYATVLDLVSQFRRCTADTGRLEIDDFSYSKEAAKHAIDRQFPHFKHHFAWLAIPALRQASEAGLISFHAEASKLP